MTPQQLFSIPNVEQDIQSAIWFTEGSDLTSDSLFREALERNIETQLNLWANTLSAENADCPTCPPQGQFQISVGLHILLDYKLRFKGDINAGWGNRWDNFSAGSSLHASVYNYGLGTAVGSKNIEYDITAAAYITLGWGDGIPSPVYTLNYHSFSPVLNSFKNSLHYGQAFTYNSAINQNQVSLENIQREGLFGFKIANVAVSTNNDTGRRPYFGIGTDWGWTGGIAVTVPIAGLGFIEGGFQDFTGKYDKNDDDEEKKMKKNKQNPSIKTHNQTPYQKSLNEASTYLRFNTKNGLGTTIDIVGPGWMQDWIHRHYSKDFRFEYQFKDKNIWGEKRW